MTPAIRDSWSLVPRREWLLCLGTNDSPLTWLTPQLCLAYSVDLLNTIRIVCTLLFSCKIGFILLVIERNYRWIIEQLTGICLPDCPPRSISTLPATTLKCSDANVSGVLILSFQSLKNNSDTWESFPPPRGVTATLGTNIQRVTHNGDTGVKWY